MAKLALVFVTVVVLVQIFSYQSDASVVRREAPATSQKNDLEETLNSIKQGFDEFVSKIENSEVYQNATKMLDEFGKKVKQQGEELVQKIKDGTTDAKPAN